MSFYLTDLDHQLGRQSMLDPHVDHSTMRLSRLAAKRYELNRALAERRRQRRANKRRSTRADRRPVARLA